MPNWAKQELTLTHLVDQIISPMLVGLWSLVKYLMVSYFVLSFFPRDVLDEVWD